MSNQVAYMTHSVNREIITRLFAKFANRYGKIWTTRLGEDGDWNACADEWLEELQQFDLAVLRQGVNVALGIYKDYPPTLGQLIDLCMKESGVPEISKVIRMMTNKDFSHPVVKMIYDKIGSWKLSNGSEKEIINLVREHYDRMINTFKTEPQNCWQKLTDYNAKPNELPPPDKKSTGKERKSFEERMVEHHKMANEAKEKLKDNRKREFDYSKLKPGSREFDELLYSEYKAYLIGIPENMVLALSVQDAYARMRFLAKCDQDEYLKEVGYVPPNQRDGFASSITSDRKTNGRPQPIYKNWAHD